MRLAIVGGRLQAMEAAYLAQAAGYDAALIDRDPHAPARGLVEEFHSTDLLADAGAYVPILRRFDMILPATEKRATLAQLSEASRRSGVPLAFDASAYEITSSKIASNRLFEQYRIPMPAPWPGCGFPVIVKPSGASGSSGVVKVKDQAGLDAIMGSNRGELVTQAYLDGPSYSLEVLGQGGDCTVFQVVLLEFDATYDCKRVLVGPETGADVAPEFRRLARGICNALKLNGIMDIEVIQTGDGLKVLEIDARLPSQTPMAVYHATGVNLLEETIHFWMNGKLPPNRIASQAPRAVILEHIRFKGGRLEIAGEHVLSRAQGLRAYQDLFGSETFISNFETFPKNWVATAVFAAKSEAAVLKRRQRALNELQREFGARAVIDPSPPRKPIFRT